MPELTPYPGGWSGNELFPDAFTEEVRGKARVYAREVRRPAPQGGLPRLLRHRHPRRPGRRGLPGRAEPAHLRRQPGHQPRRVRARRRAAVPLPPARVQRGRLRPGRQDAQRALVGPAVHRQLERDGHQVDRRRRSCASATRRSPASTGSTPDGDVEYRFFDYRRSAVETEQDGFFLRITGPGDWRYEGADLGILITRGRLMDEDGALNDRARQWLGGLTARYAARRRRSSRRRSRRSGLDLPEARPARGRCLARGRAGQGRAGAGAPGGAGALDAGLDGAGAEAGAFKIL